MAKIAFYYFDPDTLDEVPVRVVETDDKDTIDFYDGWSNGYLVSRVVGENEKIQNPDNTGILGS